MNRPAGGTARRGYPPPAPPPAPPPGVARPDAPGVFRGPARGEPRPVGPTPPGPADGRRHTGFVLTIVAVLGGCLVTLLLLNTLAAQDAFRIQALQARVGTLADTEQALQVQVQDDAAPPALAAAARRLGMAPSGVPTIYRMRYGGALAVLTAVPLPPPAPPARPGGGHAHRRHGHRRVTTGRHRHTRPGGARHPSRPHRLHRTVAHRRANRHPAPAATPTPATTPTPKPTTTPATAQPTPTGTPGTRHRHRGHR